ncbi:MAG: YbhB/YbcL family Raf kinase inhibitor-like protein [Candidatus Pacebacteria bacterium]|nr:YbhB/YbcL family Raf kinase inhibitor-like protein [Candidatus Paceibacterota bacterium]
MIRVKSSAFEANGGIPRKYTGEGEDVSPPLTWEGAPDQAKEFALICDDPDAPMDTPWVHWVLYGIPEDTRSLPEGDNVGAEDGENTWGTAGYGGPMPPPGHGAHHYHFKVYALDARLDLPPGASKDGLLSAMQGHILDQGELIGVYER